MLLGVTELDPIVGLKRASEAAAFCYVEGGLLRLASDHVLDGHRFRR
jgi:hypothetical protein